MPLFNFNSYIVTISVNDHTGQIWLNCFDDVGRQIIGKSADDIVQIKVKSLLNLFIYLFCLGGK